MSEERKTGREAQMSNIRAAVQVAETVRSTLGPAGMDKMLVDERGETIVTNDGITILRELDTAHPGAQMMVQASQTQEEVCKDGTTSVVVLAGQMLALSEGLLVRGIHPQVIVRAFNKASKIALRNMPDAEHNVAVEHVAATALRGKASESSLGFAAQIVGDAAHRVNGELERVRILTQAGGSMDSSYIHEGLVLNKTFVNPDYEGGKRHHPRILLLDGGLDGFNYEDVQMQISDPSQLEQIRQQEMQILSNVSSVIAEMCDVVIVRDGVHEAVAKYLDSQDVGVVSRVQQSDFDAISRITGVSAYHRITDVPEDAHLRIEGTVASIKIGDLDYVSVSAKESDTLTMIIRGATRQTLDEYERAFEDALGVACLFMQDKRLYPGGGAVMSKLSMIIRKHATESPDMTARERMCMEAYADSLEIIPAAIASNAGMDPLDVVMELRSCSDLEGLYIDFTGEGEITNTAELGVWEPAALIEQIISSATEVACSILRIDDIIARRGQ
jgi:chaperonin GroEL (HSP60 family)